jgi:transcriptional regulator with XRE-family HTH domain
METLRMGQTLDGEQRGQKKPPTSGNPGLFPALLKHWRARRGASQLDLALLAGVSARHVSFLETGRARPSAEMVERLGRALGISRREQNTLLRAAGFEDAWPEPSAHDRFPAAVEEALSRMMEKQEPYPLMVFDSHFNVVRQNQAATRLFARLLGPPANPSAPLNGFRCLFDPAQVRPFVANWEECAKELLWRLHMMCLQRPQDAALQELYESLFEYPDVPSHFRHPDVSRVGGPTLALRIRSPLGELAFFTTITVFSAPQNVTLEELSIESYFPLDEHTRAVCENS